MKRADEGIFVAIVAAGLLTFAGDGAAAETAWSYTGANGPAKWGKLAKEYAVCNTGTMQSPIDVPDKDVRKGDLPALLFNYKPSPLRTFDDGRTIVVTPAQDSAVTVGGKRYELVAITFHKPAEEKVNGKGFEMSAHLIHKDKDGKFAVLAVMFAPGGENAMLKTLLGNLPPSKGKEYVVDAASFNPFGLLPKSKGYYMYTGSLSTPPCTEGVTWYVLKTPVEASADQIARIGRLLPASARPIQARNDRDIVGTP